MKYLLVLVLLLPACLDSDSDDPDATEDPDATGECTSECAEGQTRCQENTVQDCILDSTSCWIWHDDEFCGAPPLYGCVEDSSGAHCIGGPDVGPDY